MYYYLVFFIDESDRRFVSIHDLQLEKTASSALLSTGHSLSFHGFFDMQLLCGKWVSPFFTII
jgi:hypothetical protein